MLFKERPPRKGLKRSQAQVHRKELVLRRERGERGELSKWCVCEREAVEASGET
jgi:hypothetical protein